jgi:hypothetical protein
MVTVSNAWKEAQKKTLLPESFVEVTYWITEPGAQPLASESNNGAVFYSDHSAITDTASKEFQKYATLENNIWLLDGGFDVLPNKAPYGDTGYIADVEYPTVTITFPNVRTELVPGVTIVWSETYGEYATRCRITALNGTEVVASEEFLNNSVRSTFNMPMAGYDTIYIEIIDWIVPDHRPRIERFYLGAMEVYTKADLVKYSHTQSVDLLSTELPKDQIVFSLNNSSDLWNPDNPVGNVRYLMDRQEVSVRYGYKLPTGVEWIPAGTFWVSEWDTPTNGLEVTFTARDLLEFLNVTYTGTKVGTLYDIAIAALSQANLPATDRGRLRYFVDESLKTIVTDFSEDDNSYTAAVILQMVANAGQCVMHQTRDGILRIEKYDGRLSDYVIGQDVSYTHPERVMTKPPHRVSVNDDMWIESVATGGESITITNPLISQADNATDVARWASEVLRRRNIVKGSYRPDPRLGVLDVVSIESKYSKDFVAAITEITYEYNGAFRGQYVGREIEV